MANNAPNIQHAAFIATMDRMEIPLKRQMVLDKNSFIEKAATRYAEHGTVNFFDLVDAHQAEIFDTLKINYNKIVPVFGALALSHVKTKSFKAEDEDSLFVDLANEWINTQGLKRSHLIADTTEADVLGAISKGIDEELGTAEIARNIRDVTDLSLWRSETIARTEVHQAATYAQQESVKNAQDKLGVTMEKAWSPTLDSRTRPDHAAMEGTPFIPLDESYIVGGEALLRPGDPSGSADNTIGCRCAEVYQEAKQ